MYILPYWISCASEVPCKAPVFLWEVKLSAANNAPLCIWRIVWFWLGGLPLLFSTIRSPGNTLLWSVAHVANTSTEHYTVSTPWVNCNQTQLIIVTMLSHQIHVLKIHATVHYKALNVLKWQWLTTELVHLHIRVWTMCLQGVTIWTQNHHHQPPAECVCLIWLWFGIYQPLLAGNQPSLGGPVFFFQIFQLAAEIASKDGWFWQATATADMICKSSFPVPLKSVLEVNEDRTVTTYQQQGLIEILSG